MLGAAVGKRAGPRLHEVDVALGLGALEPSGQGEVGEGVLEGIGHPANLSRQDEVAKTPKPGNQAWLSRRTRSWAAAARSCRLATARRVSRTSSTEA